MTEGQTQAQAHALICPAAENTACVVAEGVATVRGTAMQLWKDTEPNQLLQSLCLPPP